MAEDSVIVMLNGRPFDGWQDVSITQSFDSVTGDCKLKITELPNDPFPAPVGTVAQVILAGRPVITGHVHEVSGKHDSSSHAIDLTIRDKTQDFVDSTVGPNVKFEPPVNQKQVIDGTLKKMGLSGIKVIDKVGADPFRKGGELPVADIEETGFSWADRWTRMRQTVMTTDGEGNIVLDQNKQRMGSGSLIKTFEDGFINNVLAATYKNTDFGRHHVTGIPSQKSTNDPYWEERDKGDDPAQADPLSNAWGLARDTAIRGERRLHRRARRSLEGKSPTKAAKWRSNLARSRGFQYVATVSGFTTQGGELWWPGFIIPVRDDHFLVSDMLFISQVTFTKSLRDGAKTEITCTYKDSFSEEGEGKGPGRTGKGGIGNSEPGSYDDVDLSSINYGSFK